MRVVVVGAGATGLGVAWDLSLRGVEVIVLEQGDIAHGTSGRFHGLLHSGARYVMRDPKAAQECYQENQILRKIAAGSIEPVGGYFVEPESTDVSYSERWIQAMQRLGIEAVETSVSEARRRVPELNPNLRRTFLVPDGVINGFDLLFRLSRGIEMHGGSIRLETRLTAVDVDALGRVAGVRVESVRHGVETIRCDGLINAAGPYASAVAKLFDDPFSMRLSRGVMLVFADRKVPMVINRLAPAGDGDILVPHDRISIWGTTDEPTDDPQAAPPSLAESRQLLDLAEDLFPQMPRWRVLRAFAGVRPLYQPNPVGESREVTRDFTIIDHGIRGGPKAIVSVVGGKWVTYRLMAEQAVDALAGQLGLSVPATTRTTPLPTLSSGPGQKDDSAGNLCECEEVGRSDLAAWPTSSLSQLRTRTWFSMGPCQGTFCLHRVAETRLDQTDVRQLDHEMAGLRQERDGGMRAVLWGDNAREWALSRTIQRQVLAEDEGS